MRVLRDYQRRVLNWLGTHRFAGVFLEMRLGKTLLMIRHIRRLEIKNILVVAPYSALSSWESELEAENLPYRYLTIKHRNFIHATHKIDVPYFVLTNKESHLSFSEELKKYKWDCIILDESTFIKTPDTRISKFYVDNFKDVKYKYILTGTPAPENPLDYIQQLRFLGIEKRTYWQLRFDYFIKAFEHDFSISVKGELWLNKILSDNCYFLSRKECNIGGQKTYIKRLIPMTPQIEKLYKLCVKEFLLDDNTRTIFSTQQFIWLRRLCGGFKDKAFIDKYKVQELMDLLNNELSGKNGIIWCNFIEEIKILSKIFLNLKIRHDYIYGDVVPEVRKEVINSFKNNNFRLLIVQPETVKYGVDLSCADFSIYFSSPCGLETRQQSEDRIALNDSPLIIDLITENSVDEDIYDSWLKKESRFEMQKRIIKRLQKIKEMR